MRGNPIKEYSVQACVLLADHVISDVAAATSSGLSLNSTLQCHMELVYIGG